MINKEYKEKNILIRLLKFNQNIFHLKIEGTLYLQNFYLMKAMLHENAMHFSGKIILIDTLQLNEIDSSGFASISNIVLNQTKTIGQVGLIVTNELIKSVFKSLFINHNSCLYYFNTSEEGLNFFNQDEDLL